MLSENTKKIYNGQSNMYDFLFKMFFFPRQEHVIKTIKINKGHKILDLGVGTGLSLPLYPDRCEVTGIDFSVDMLEKARDRVKKLGLRHITLREMDAANLDFDDNTFDYVIATFVITVVEDPVKVISEMKRVCKKEGTLVIVNHFKSGNPLVAKVEKFLNPVTSKIGWRNDVCLNELVSKTGLQIHRQYKLKKIDFWNVIFAGNNKTC